MALPSLHLLSHLERWEFRDEEGVEVAALEERAGGKMSLIGVRRGLGVTLSAPVKGGVGDARVSLCEAEGVCKDENGVNATRLFLAAMHNRNMGHVIVHAGYIIGRINF